MDGIYFLAGIKVNFPFKAYPPQIIMMEKIIKSLTRSENCLVESPTGCGKTLSLLCSILAWQTSQNVFNDKKNNLCDDSCLSMASNKGPENVLQSNEKSNQKQENRKCDDESGLSCNNCDCLESDIAFSTRRSRVPKIYFASRTHKQLSQVVRELKRTIYRRVKMTILASREHTCINPAVNRRPNKGEECKNLLENSGCSYYDKVKTAFTHDKLCSRGLQDAWDIEDLVKYGRKMKGCPYFGSRELKQDADIIFCPYNYLIDPIIRKTMEISVKGNIVVLDEAHNIEDFSREAASFTISIDHLDGASQELDVLRKSDSPNSHNYELLQTMCEHLSALIKKHSLMNDREFGKSTRVWSGTEVIPQLDLIGLGSENIAHVKKAYESLVALESLEELKRKQKNKSKTVETKMSSSTSSILEGLFVVLNFMYMENNKYLDDYRFALTRELVHHSRELVDTEGVWLNKRKRHETKSCWNYQLHFWCMNSSVAFLDMCAGARSVILTSGTLSPMSSFKSELGLTFHITLETNHVIDQNQVLVQCLSRGPNNLNLLGNYLNSEKWSYQDEIGNLLLSICQVVPHGVLCFLSSYSMLDKLSSRWKDTKLMDKLSAIKDVYLEPRSCGKDDFNDVMKSYYESIRKTTTGNHSNHVTGAIFLAVCRGKVSEGMDFADSYARAVVVVGIPYPNIKDAQVNQKKCYNDNKSSGGLLPGNIWYEIQAFRALNQALGRCIRHKNDWGVIVLVDERHAKNSKNCSYFSKWIRKRLQSYDNFHLAMSHLQDFINRHTFWKSTSESEQNYSSKSVDLFTLKVSDVEVCEPQAHRLTEICINSSEENVSSSVSQREKVSPFKNSCINGTGEFKLNISNHTTLSIIDSLDTTASGINLISKALAISSPGVTSEVSSIDSTTILPPKSFTTPHSPNDEMDFGVDEFEDAMMFSIPSTSRGSTSLDFHQFSAGEKQEIYQRKMSEFETSGVIGNDLSKATKRQVNKLVDSNKVKEKDDTWSLFHQEEYNTDEDFQDVQCGSKLKTAAKKGSQTMKSRQSRKKRHKFPSRRSLKFDSGSAD